MAKLLESRKRGLNANRAAEIIGAPTDSIRPRFTELKKRGVLVETDRFGESRNGNKQRILIHVSHA